MGNGNGNGNGVIVVFIQTVRRLGLSENMRVISPPPNGE